VLLAAPALVAFAWQHGIATLRDDSVSYLVLARHFAPGPAAVSEPWVAHFAHFPPLFPWVLAMSGAAYRLLVAHLLVAACAIAALALLQRHAARELGSASLGVLVGALFLATPAAWIAVKPILPETMYLLLVLAALEYHAARACDEGASRVRAALLGALLAAACLTRLAGVSLVTAHAVHAALLWRERRARPAALVLPLAVVACAVAAWIVLRPAVRVDDYERVGASMAAAWIAQPLTTMRIALESFIDGWVALFMLEPAVSRAVRVLLVALLLLGLAGAVRRAAANRLAAWYVLASCPMVFVWVFEPDNTRRLLYPVLPFVLMYAIDLAVHLSARVRLPVLRRALVAAVAVVPPALALPALAIMLERGLDRAVVAPHSGQALADNLRYYLNIDEATARREAAAEVALFDGMAALATATPPGARVMWVRPEYVAVLGLRAGVPFYYGWDAERLAREVRARRVDDVIISAMYKTDLARGVGDPARVLSGVPGFAREVLATRSAADGRSEFRLMRVEPERGAPAPGR
jgi:hypothetical protein